MGSKDERIVQMTFDNQQFEKGVAQSRQSLKDLERSLQLEQGTEGFRNISRAADNIDFGSIVKNIEDLRNRFSFFGIVGMKVMEEIATAAIGLGKKLWGMTFGQIKSGGITRAMNIENARFMLEGLLKDESKVQAVFDDASNSVTGTAYSLDAAAKAASQFVASGMEAGTELQTALRAVVGTAAMTNSEYEEISRIFTTAAGNGRLMGDQLLSLSSRGLNAAATLAEFFNGVNKGSKTASEDVTKYIKTLTKGVDVTEADIREFVSKSKISFAVFSEAMDEAFGEHALKANETLTGAFSNVKAALSRTGEAFVAPLVEKNGPLVDLLNALRVKINDINKKLIPFSELFTSTVTNVANRLTYLLKFIKFEWIFDGLAAGLKLIASLLKPVGEAFTEVFGSKKRSEINLMLLHFKQFMTGLKANEGMLKNIRNTFGGFFAIISIGLQIVSALVKQLAPLGNVFLKLSDLVSGVKGSFGEYLINLNKTLKETDYFNVKFGQIKDNIVAFIDKIKEKFSSFSGVADTIKRVWKSIRDAFKSNVDEEKISKLTEVLNVLKDVFTRIGDIAVKFGRLVKAAFQNLYDGIDKSSVSSTILNGFTAVLQILAGVLGVVVDLVIELGGELHKIVSQGLENFSFDKLIDLAEGGAGLVVLSKLASVLNDFARSVDAKTLMSIAKAVLMIVGSLAILSMLDEKKVDHALGTITAVISELLIAYNAMTGLFSKVPKIENSNKGIIGMIAMATGLNHIGTLLLEARNLLRAQILITIAGAVLILVAAIAALAFIPEDKLNKAMKAVTVLIAELVIAFAFLSKSFKKGFAGKAASTIVGFAAAVLILSFALVKLSKLDENKMAQGITGIGALLLELAIFMRIVRGSAFNASSGVGLIALAIAMEILYDVIKKFAGMKTDQLAKGIIALGGALILIAIALRMMPGTSGFKKTTDELTGKHTSFIKVAAAVVILAGAMEIFADVIAKMSTLSWEGIAKGLAAILVALGWSALVLKEMDASGVIKKSAAIVILASSMEIFTDVIQKLGGMKLENLAKGLGAIIIALGAAVIALRKLSQGDSMFSNDSGILAINKSGSVLKAAGSILIVAAALEIIADVIGKMGTMPIEHIGIGLLGMAGGLAAIVVALKVLGKDMGIFKAAASILVVAAALRVLVPVISAIGAMPIEQLMIGLLGMFAVFETITVAALIIKKAGVGAALLKLSSAMLMLGVGTAALGVGLTLCVAALAAFMALIMSTGAAADTLSKAIDSIITGVLMSLGSALDGLMNIIGQWLINLVEYLALHGDDVIKACVTITRLIADAIAAVLPLLLYTVGRALAESAKALIDSGIAKDIFNSLIILLEQALDLLIDHTPTLVDKLVQLVCVLVDNLNKNLYIILDHLLVFVENFLNGLAVLIVKHSDPVVNAIKNILVAIVYLATSLLQGLLNALGLTEWANSLEDFKNTLKNTLTPESSKGVGTGYMDGLISGVKSKKQEYLEEIFDIAHQTNDAFNDDPKRRYLNDTSTYNVSSETGKQLYGSGAGELLTKGLMSSDAATRAYAEKVQRMTNNVAEQEQMMSDYLDTVVQAESAIDPVLAELKRKTGAATEDVKGQQYLYGSNAGEYTALGLMSKDKEIREAAEQIAASTTDPFEREAKMKAYFARRDADETTKNFTSEQKKVWDATSKEGVSTAKKVTKDITSAFSPKIGGNTLLKNHDSFLSYILPRPGAVERLGEVFHSDVIKGLGSATSTSNWHTIGKMMSDGIGKSVSSQEAVNTISESMGKTLESGTYSSFNTQGVKAKAKNGIDGLFGIITGGISKLTPTFTTGGEKNVGGYLDGISSGDVDLSNILNEMGNDGTHILGAFKSAFGDKGSQSSGSYVTGIGSKLVDVANKATDLAKAGADASGSKKAQFEISGKESGKRFGSGLEVVLSIIKAAAAVLARGGIEALGARKDQFTTKGREAGQGFANGMEEKNSVVYNKAWSLAGRALAGLQERLRSNSPSKETMALGNYAGDGFAIGISQYGTTVKRISEDLAEEALDGLQNGIKEIARIADMDMDYAPTIRPVLDLNNITNGITAMNGMFDQSHAIAAQASFDMYQTYGEPDYITQFAKMAADNESRMSKIIDKQTDVLLDIRTRLAHQQIVLDSGELVGATINKIDEALGERMFRAERGNG